MHDSFNIKYIYRHIWLLYILTIFTHFSQKILVLAKAFSRNWITMGRFYATPEAKVAYKTKNGESSDNRRREEL